MKNKRHLFLLYIDPGSGSLILQIVLGFIAAIATFFKLFWSRIKMIVGKLFSKKTSDE